MTNKPTEKQAEILQRMASGGKLVCLYSFRNTLERYRLWSDGKPSNVHTNTAIALINRKWIEQSPDKGAAFATEYRLTDAGRLALDGYNAIKQVAADLMQPYVDHAAHTAPAQPSAAVDDAVTEYVYINFARPAWKGETVPAEGFIRAYRAKHPVWDAAECAVYNRKLGRAELERYELRPYSDNAYEFTVGQRVTWLYNDDTYAITGREDGRYHLLHECGEEQGFVKEIELTPAFVYDSSPVMTVTMADVPAAPAGSAVTGDDTLAELDAIEQIAVTKMSNGLAELDKIMNALEEHQRRAEEFEKMVFDREIERKDAEITRLRAAVAAAERERDAIAEVLKTAHQHIVECEQRIEEKGNHWDAEVRDDVHREKAFRDGMARVVKLVESALTDEDPDAAVIALARSRAATDSGVRHSIEDVEAELEAMWSEDDEQ